VKENSTEKPCPPGWGLGVGLITPSHNTSLIMETASSVINGCSTTTCHTPNDVFVSWVDGAVMAIGEIRKEAHIQIKLLAGPKTKVKDSGLLQEKLRQVAKVVLCIMPHLCKGWLPK